MMVNGFSVLTALLLAVGTIGSEGYRSQLNLHKSGSQCSFVHEHDIEANWMLVKNYLANSAASTNPQALYNTADYINPLLEGVIALYCHENKNTSGCFFYLDQVASILKNGANGTVLINELFVDMGGSWVKEEFDPPISLWQLNNSAVEHPIEIPLDSAQFVYTNTRLLRAIAEFSSSSDRSANMWSFIEAMSQLVTKDQLWRWVFGPGIWQVHGWGCSGCEVPYNHSVYFRKKGNWEFGRTSGPKYCNAVQDVDMWVVTSVIHLLATHRADSTVVKLYPAEQDAFLEYIRMAVPIIESRIDTGPNQAVPAAGGGFAFDVGLWDDHPDWAWARYQGDTYPNNVSHPPPAPVNVTWDTSHGQRFVNVMITLDTMPEDFRPLPQSRSGSDESPQLKDGSNKWTLNLAKQFSLGIFNQNCTHPLFSNFLDSHGWYRVGYNGAGWGYGLGDDGCESSIHGGYGLLAYYANRFTSSSSSSSSSAVSTAIACVDALLPRPQGARPVVTERSNSSTSWLTERFYVMWSDYQRTPSTWELGTLDTALRLVMFYPAVVQC